ncbi:metal ABC transporter solute-binding protein, Zn/Mn family [Levilactobacillus bambusae]|uniref:Metal ABC transporter substrate-binding protein n=1 Tax=Levilactobacillus bambusae TaxID=2024736 RepID=A0A2V1MZR6_9LACO|nr:zinc ABC transporter substrate-binding protein [Levilactobacillus bambusae]PWG00477.1 metal ABC transporter substrate-binding protein [Levilactobacillus bambusae]
MKNRRSGLRWLGLIGLVVLIGALLTACQNGKRTNQAATKDKLKIITTTDFYGEAARAVAGNKGTVTAVINNPAVDPHDYEPTSKIASEVSDANVVVANGLGYDSWMNRLAKDGKGRYVKIGETVMHKKAGDNPHIWYDPTTMPKYANYLADQLGKIQPQNKAYFHKNAQKYVQSLKPIKTLMAQLKQQAAHRKTTNQVYVSEPVFDYAINALGYKVGDKNFEAAVERGTDPAPKEIVAMQNGIKHRQIAFFVDNKQVSNQNVEALVKTAQASNVPVLKVTETLPKGMTYKSWMMSQYQDLSQILTKQDQAVK